MDEGARQAHGWLLEPILRLQQATTSQHPPAEKAKQIPSTARESASVATTATKEVVVAELKIVTTEEILTTSVFCLLFLASGSISLECPCLLGTS